MSYTKFPLSAKILQRIIKDNIKTRSATFIKHISNYIQLQYKCHIHSHEKSYASKKLYKCNIIFVWRNVRLQPCIFRKMKHNVNKIICVLWLLNVTRIKNLSRMRKRLMMFCLKGYYYGWHTKGRVEKGK